MSLYKVYTRLVESPLPDYVNKDFINKSKNLNSIYSEFKIGIRDKHFDPKTNKIVKATLKKLENMQLGVGSSRLVLLTNNNTAIKIAITEHGLEQNETELFFLFNLPEKIKYLCPTVIDYDEESYFIKRKKLSGALWLEVELLKIDHGSHTHFYNNFNDFFGVDFSDARDLSLGNFKIRNEIDEEIKKHWEEDFRCQDLQELVNYCRKEKLAMADVFVENNWGLRKEQPVLLDVGLRI